MPSNFKVQLNGGPVTDFPSKTSIYEHAAIAAAALLPAPQLPFDDRFLTQDGEELVLVKIWSPELVIERWPGDHTYGPYYYGISNSGKAYLFFDHQLDAKYK